jgi:predicted DNA-binding mobile mystery protein A
MKGEAVPRQGSVREIRTALGLSQSQLAKRAGVSRATVQQMERAEAQRRITLASLDKLAAAMDCQVAVAILPRGGSLEDVRLRQAAMKADAILHERTKDNKRPPRPADLERRKQQLVTRLLRGSRRRLWKPL